MLCSLLYLEKTPDIIGKYFEKVLLSFTFFKNAAYYTILFCEINNKRTFFLHASPLILQLAYLTILVSFNAF